MTCTERGHRKGVQEIIQLLEVALFQLEEKRRGKAQENGEETEREGKNNVFDGLKKEREEMKKSYFSVLGGNRKSDILFIKNSSRFEEKEIYNEIISDKKKVKHIRRVIPVRAIFTLTLENLEKETEKVVKEVEDVGDIKNKTFCISVTKRLCSHIEREQIITAVAKKIALKADLSHPDILVVVEVVRDLCALGILSPCPSNFNLTRNPIHQP